MATKTQERLETPHSSLISGTNIQFDSHDMKMIIGFYCKHFGVPVTASDITFSVSGEGELHANIKTAFDVKHPRSQ